MNYLTNVQGYLRGILQSERGQGVLEYLGMTFIAVVLVAALIDFLAAGGWEQFGKEFAGIIQGIVDSFRTVDQLRAG